MSLFCFRKNCFHYANHRFQSIVVAGVIFLVAGATDIEQSYSADTATKNEAAKSETSSVEGSTEQRLAEAIRFISSDDLEGRGVGTAGLDKAADYIAKQYAEMGLKTDRFDGKAFQNFKITRSSDQGPKEKNHVSLVGPKDDQGLPQKIELVLDTDFTPLAVGGSGKFDLPLVFVGYGITLHKAVGEEKPSYDDYANVDVKGKAVLIIRHALDQANPHSKFGGGNDSEYAPVVRKISNAYEHGAVAVILCTDSFDIQRTLKEQQKRWQTALDNLNKVDAEYRKLEKPTREQAEKHFKTIEDLSGKVAEAGKKLAAASDPLYGFQGAGPGGDGGRDIPVLHTRRAPLDRVFKIALQSELSVIEADIDRDLHPHSYELTGWQIQGETNVVRKENTVKNIVAVLEGEGPLADETLVIGAHYDHVGRGGPGSGAADPRLTDIHHGADDNGSGTVALLEVARKITSLGRKLPRRIVFISFTGEERGLLGSARYVREPAFPLDKTIAMLNMDMVGRLTDEKIIIYGTGTAPEFDSMVDRYCRKYGLGVHKDPSGFGPSDHASFYAKEIPVLHYFTGMHKDYHRPTDVAAKINISGMRRISEMVTEMALEIVDNEKRPQYLQVKGSAKIDKSGSRPYFGSIPDFAQDQPGYALTGVTKDGPAEKAGIQAGDIIIKLGESKIGNLDDFDNALRKFKGGDKAPVTVKRGEEEKTFTVTLDDPRE